MDPRRSARYLFCRKRCDRIKALLWETDGFVRLYKRLEVQGRFRWPRNQLEVKQLTWQQLDWLMSGLEIEQPSMQNLSCKASAGIRRQMALKVIINLPDIKRCSCRAHVRRYFTDAVPKGNEYDYKLLEEGH